MVRRRGRGNVRRVGGDHRQFISPVTYLELSILFCFQRMDSPNRTEFLKNLKPGGKYAGIIGVYRHNISANVIGVFDPTIISALADAGVKWIAHNGAGYDQIDIPACIAKGEQTVLVTTCEHNVRSRYQGVTHTERCR